MANYEFANNKCKIKPTGLQKSILFRWAGARRFVFNKAVQGLSEDEIRSTKWLTEIPADVVRNALTDYRQQIKRGQRVRFKSRTNSCPGFRLSLKGNRLSRGELTIPGLGSLRLRGYRDIPGQLIAYQFTIDKAGDFWVTISRRITLPIPTPPANPLRVWGIDLGLSTLFSVANIKVDRPDFTSPQRERINRLAAKIKNAKQGGARHRKYTHRLAIVLRKIANRLHHYLHEKSSRIVKQCEGLGLETLDCQQISNSHRSNMSISIGRAYYFLQYKAAHLGKPIHYVSKWYPSSKKCSHCGYVNRNLAISDRTWICPSCLTVLDRDFNSSENLRNEAIKAFFASGLG